MRKYIGLGILALTVVAFQNCGRVAFDSGASGESKTGFVAGPEIKDVIESEDVVKDNTIVDDTITDDTVKEDEIVIVVEDKEDETTKEEDEVAVVDDKKDDVKHEDKKDDATQEEEEVVVVVEDKKDETAKEEKEEKEEVAVVEDKKEDKKDEFKEEKKQDTVAGDDLELFACSSDEGGQSKKVLICHYSSQDQTRGQTKCLPRQALKGHIHSDTSAKHRDTLGACANEDLASAQ